MTKRKGPQDAETYAGTMLADQRTAELEGLVREALRLHEGMYVNRAELQADWALRARKVLEG